VTPFCFESTETSRNTGVSKFNTTIGKLSQVTYTTDCFFENWCLCIGSKHLWVFVLTKSVSSPVY